MPEHYFSENPESPHHLAQCKASYRGREFNFETDAGVFSRDGIDKGTEILLNALPELSGDVLDLGCGWGAIGVCVAGAFPKAQVTMADINSRAVELSRGNVKRNNVQARVLQSDGFEGLGGERFSFILLNPPIRAGKQVIYGMFEKSAEHLATGGSLYIVIRKQQGAPSALTFLSTVFKSVQVVEKEAWFWVIRAD
jgi:16S rRNA (guanine1207-N2)-methyltransferase